ncbi:glycoside hydrolase [Diplogelasinospora grovesii]|uniref:endo-polygalacturonase n=1 Tax=Diplogelasinospora grovesii TaxID=303347 RepID=A0AAN6S1U0_9PEZI|nr:glycoside hydrolase [Diplogelasinospora grovesii]
MGHFTAFLSLLLCISFEVSASSWQPGILSPRRPTFQRSLPCTFNGTTGFSQLKYLNSSCADIILSNLTVPAGVTLDLRRLQPNTTVTFDGQTSWGFQEWAGPLLSISGINITITGAPGSVLNGSGELWWDGKGQSGKKKPKFFQAHALINSSISDIHILNSPVHVFSISDCHNLTLTNVTIDNSGGDGPGLGGNTDGFDISASTNITIIGAKVHNQDDCVAINSGANITFRDGVCIGGHGLSVGSIGGRGDNTVANVLFEDSVIADSQNGVRIKTKHGQNGTVTRITYKNIRLQNITKYGIDIDQSYGATGQPPTTGVPITDLTLVNVTGTVGGTGTKVFVNCGEGSCSAWNWTEVAVTGGKNSTKCLHLPVGVWC